MSNFNDEETKQKIFNFLLATDFIVNQEGKGDGNIFFLPSFFNKTPRTVLVKATSINEIFRKNEWIVTYNIPFTSPLWSVLFTKMRNFLLFDENRFLMEEKFWKDSFFIYFKEISDNLEQTILVQAKINNVSYQSIKKKENIFIYDEKTEQNKKEQEVFFPSFITLRILMNENPKNLFLSLHKEFLNFASKNFPFFYEKIDYSIKRNSQSEKMIYVQSNERNVPEEKLLSNQSKCVFCGFNSPISQEIKECENCKTINPFLGKLFQILKTTGEGIFERIYQAKCLSTSTIVNIQERLIDNDVHLSKWKKLLHSLNIVRTEIPSLTYVKYLPLIDDPFLLFKEKYLISQYFQGLFFISFIYFSCLFNLNRRKFVFHFCKKFKRSHVFK